MVVCTKHFLSTAEVWWGSRPRVKFSGAVQSSVNPGRSVRVSCLRSDHISGNAGGLRHCYVQRVTYCSIRTDMSSTAETCSAGYSNIYGNPKVGYSEQIRGWTGVVRGFLVAFAKLSKATINLAMSVCLSLCPRGTAWLPLDGCSCWYLSIFRKSVEKIQVLIKIWQEYWVFYMKTNRLFLILSRSFLLRMGNVRTKFVEKIKMHFVCSINFFLENSAFYEIMCKNIGEPGRSHEKRARQQIHTDDYVILIAFPLQQLLHLPVSMLRYTYISCLVILVFSVQLWSYFTIIVKRTQKKKSSRPEKLNFSLWKYSCEIFGCAALC